MSEQLISFVSFIGTAAFGISAVTGAYIWLRWGWCGVAAIWSIRKTLDLEVCEAVKGAIVNLGQANEMTTSSEQGGRK